MFPLAPPLWAQQAPGAAQPGQIEQQFRAPPAAPATPRQIELPEPAPEPIPEGAERQRFTVRRIEIEGASAYPAGTFTAQADELAGKEISLKDLYELANRITTRYRNDGYILSRALVPAATLDGGVANIRVIEGFVDRVSIDGMLAEPSVTVQAIADRITAARPLTVAALERYLLLVNDLAGVNAQAVLTPAASGAIGGADLKLFVRQQRVGAAIELNNRGSRALGPQRIDADLLLNSALGGFSRLRLFGSSTLNKELNFVSLTGDFLIGREGLVAGVAGSTSAAHPDPAQGAGVQFDSKSSTLSARLAYPVIRSRRSNLLVRAQLSALNGRTDGNGALLSQDRIRALRFGGTYDWLDRAAGINQFDLEYSHGLSGLGASEPGMAHLSRESGRPDFRKLSLFASRLQSMTQRWSLLLALQGQKAFTDLLIPEQFGFGGLPFGRGYNYSELLGDDGVQGKLELRFDGTSTGAIGNYGVYGFYDVGKVWRRNAITIQSGASAASAGVGVRLNVSRSVAVSLELAKPLTRDVAAERDRDLRLFGALRWAM